MLIVLGASFSAFSQGKFIAKNAYISFYSSTPLENILGESNEAVTILDSSNGEIVFQALMTTFHFKRALMEEHFNENYVESDKFPDAKFVGKVANIKDINLTKDGVYDANVEGKLTMHGVTKEVSEKGTLEVKQGKVIGKAKFNLLVADYKITIPGNVGNNISKTIEVTVDISLDKANM